MHNNFQNNFQNKMQRIEFRKISCNPTGQALVVLGCATNWEEFGLFFDCCKQSLKWHLHPPIDQTLFPVALFVAFLFVDLFVDLFVAKDISIVRLSKLDLYR